MHQWIQPKAQNVKKGHYIGIVLDNKVNWSAIFQHERDALPRVKRAIWLLLALLAEEVLVCLESLACGCCCACFQCFTTHGFAIELCQVRDLINIVTCRSKSPFQSILLDFINLIIILWLPSNRRFNHLLLPSLESPRVRPIQHAHNLWEIQLASPT